MKLPASILVGPHRYRVRTGKQHDRILGDNAGHCVADQLTIRISRDLPPSVKAETVLHEALHAIWDQSPMRNREDDVEEDVVSMFAPPLLDLLRRNPVLVAFLLADA